MKSPLAFDLLFLLTAIMLTINSNAQTKKNQPLDVYKVDFEYYIRSIDTSRVSEKPMMAQMKQMDKADQTLLQVYVHPEYLYAKDNWTGGEERIWLIQYKAGNLIQLMVKEALQMDFAYHMRTDVLLPKEGFKERWKAHGRITLTNDTLTVAGYRCKRAVINYTPDAVRPGDKYRETTVWYCPELPRFYLPSFEYLQKIPGMALLIYDNRGYDLIEGCKVVRIVKQQKPLSFFNVPKGIKIIK